MVRYVSLHVFSHAIGKTKESELNGNKTSSNFVESFSYTQPNTFETFLNCRSDNEHWAQRKQDDCTVHILQHTHTDTDAGGVT